MPVSKPYKILVRSEKGCAYDILICIKCCETILRSNFSRHKHQKKHIELHKSEQVTMDHVDIERNKEKQIAKVIKYHNIHQYDLDNNLLCIYKDKNDILEKYSNFNPKFIYACCNKKYKTAYKYIWQFE